jgi:arylsulfatase A-like enzyme/Flp pilus assembly protein TadD
MRRWWTASHWLAVLCATTGALIVLLRPPTSNDLSTLAAAQIVTPAKRGNPIPIILISVDTLRADHLSSYGYKGPATVHIDRIGAGGTIFLQVNSQVPLTLPSHVSLLTSSYPFANRIEDNGEQLAPDAVTLARVLKSQGYRTAAFVGGFVLDRRFGLNQGFDVYDGPSNPHPKPGEDPGDVKRFGENVTRAAMQWLEQNADHPFFLFVHLYDLHTPYKLPVSEHRRGLGYDAELGYVDEVLGKFWDVLEQRGLIRRALVVFTSDHGESLHEHGESTHGYFVYQSTLRVPLIIHWPSKPSSFATRIAEPVSLLDVAPTVLQIAGFSPPAEFQGRNLLNLITRSAATAPKASAPEEIYSESLYPHAHFGTSALRTLCVGRYKYIQAPRPEFYDLVKDPDEEQNLYETQKSIALTFRKRLELLHVRYHSKRVSASAAPAPEVMEQLRSLGYLAGDAARTSTFDSGVDPKDRVAEYEKYGRAVALGSAGHLRASNARLKELLDKDPGLPDVLTSLGLNQQKLGRHAEAAENFKAVLKQNPISVVAHFDLAVSDYSLGRREDAVKDLEATLLLAPYYVRAEEMLGNLYLEAKDYEKARRHLNHVIELDPASYAANYNLGALDCLQGNWQQGDRHLRAAIQADPTSAEAHNTLGSLHLLRGDVEHARMNFVEAIRLNPRFASAHYNLGMIFRQQHRNEEAAREFHEALSADPQFHPARRALDDLDFARGQNE